MVQKWARPVKNGVRGDPENHLFRIRPGRKPKLPNCDINLQYRNKMFCSIPDLSFVLLCFYGFEIFLGYTFFGQISGIFVEQIIKSDYEKKIIGVKHCFG